MTCLDSGDEISHAAEREACDREHKARDAEIREEKAVSKRRRVDRGVDIRREGRQALTCRQESLEAKHHPEERKANESREAHENEMLRASWGVLPEAARAILSRVSQLFKF